MEDKRENPGVEEPKKVKKRGAAKAAKAVIWILVIAAVVALTLFLTVRIGEFGSLSELFAWIGNRI